MANQIRGKYHTVKVIPVCNTGDTANGNILFDGTEIPNACYPGGTSLLKQIRVFDKEDVNHDLELLFFSHKPVTEGLNETAVNFTITGGDATDEEVQNANPLAFLTIDVSEIADTTNDTGIVKKNKLDFTASRTSYDSGSLDIFVNSDPTEAQIADGTGIPGSIFFMGISTSNVGNDRTASALTFEFVFEVY